MSNTNNTPLISVIIPVFNVEKYLKRCHDSVINQTYKNIEIILIDDGSTDNSGKMCDEYAKQDNRIKVIHQKNAGLSAARNSGLDICKGEYISFVDSDDWIGLKFIEILYQSLIKYNVDICMCNSFRCDNIGKFKNREIEISNFQKDGILDVKKNIPSVYAWGKFFKRKIFDNFRFPVGEFSEDICLLSKCILNFTFAYTSIQLYFYYKRSDSITNADKGVAFERSEDIKLWINTETQKKYIERLGLPYFERTLITNSGEINKKIALLCAAFW